MVTFRELVGAVFGFNEEIETLKSDQDSLSKSLRHTIEVVTADKATAENRVKECQEAFAKVEEMYKTLNNTLHEKQEEINALQEENARLKAEQADRMKLLGKIGNLSGQNKKLKTALDDMDKRVLDLINQLKRKEN